MYPCIRTQGLEYIYQTSMKRKPFTLCSCMPSLFSLIWLFAIPMNYSPQVFLSMGFSKQECWNGLPRPPLGNLPDPGTEPMSFMSPALAGRFFTTSVPWEARLIFIEQLLCAGHSPWGGVPSSVTFYWGRDEKSFNRMTGNKYHEQNYEAGKGEKMSVGMKVRIPQGRWDGLT